MSAVPKQGTEARTSIIPSMAPSGLGFFGSPYSPANAMLTPNEIGVTVGDSMSDVANGVKGVQFYIDQIGFGAPSTGLTNGMPLKPLGVNYFINTGSKCSNGATMWTYMKGIPDGNALGERAKEAMEKMIQAVDDYHISGIETTLSFGKFVMRHEAFRSGNFDTKFIDNYFKPEMLNEALEEDEELVAAIAADAFWNVASPELDSGPLSQHNTNKSFSPWRLNRAGKR